MSCPWRSMATLEVTSATIDPRVVGDDAGRFRIEIGPGEEGRDLVRILISSDVPEAERAQLAATVLLALKLQAMARGASKFRTTRLAA